MSAAILAFGAVSGLGEGAAAFSAGVVGERARVALRIDDELVGAGLSRPFAARARVDPADGDTDRATSLLTNAMVACTKDLERVLPTWRDLRVGLALGTSSGGMRTAERIFAAYLRPDAAQPARSELTRGFYFSPMQQVVAALGIEANPATLVLGACAASTLAIGLGMRWLEEGACDVVLAGGFDAVSVFVASGFEVLRATTARLPPRPFRVDRDGMALGEGAAVLALRPASVAPHARVYVTGFGASSDAVHLTAPDRTGRGLAAAARAALGEAGVTTVDLVSAHATATSFSDAAEARAIEALFSDAASIVVHPFKAQIGHTLGASGVLEVLSCVDAIKRGVFPAGAGEGLMDPDARVRLLDVTEAGSPRLALKLSAAFGGANAALVVAKEAPSARARRALRSCYLGAPVYLRDPPEAQLLADAIGWPLERVARADPLARMALAAVSELVRRDGSLSGAGVVVGASFATFETNAAFFSRLQERGPRMAEPRKFPYTSPNAAAGDCSAAFGLTGPSFAVGAGLHAALEALIVGATLVRSGDAPRVVVVAVDDIGAFAGRLATALDVVATSGVVALVLSADPDRAIARVMETELGVGKRRHGTVACGHRALLPLLADTLPSSLEASGGDLLPTGTGVPATFAWARVALTPRN